MTSLSFEEELSALLEEYLKTNDDFSVKMFKLFDKDPVKLIELGLKYLIKDTIGMIDQTLEHIVKITPEQEQEIKNVFTKVYIELRNDESIKNIIQKIIMSDTKRHSNNEITKEQADSIITNMLEGNPDKEKILLSMDNSKENWDKSHEEYLTGKRFI